jgi:hypothetical protein
MRLRGFEQLPQSRVGAVKVLARAHGHHHAEEQVALERRHVGQVGQPELVGPLRLEAPLHEVERRRRLRVGNRHPPTLAAPGDALQLEPAHQAGDPLAADVQVVLVRELELDARRAVGLERAVVDRHDQPGQLVIAQLAEARAAPAPRVEALACHAEHPAEPGDSMLCLLRLDQPVLHHC